LRRALRSHQTTLAQGGRRACNVRRQFRGPFQASRSDRCAVRRLRVAVRSRRGWGAVRRVRRARAGRAPHGPVRSAHSQPCGQFHFA
jgi:hypothetical protein